MSVSPLIREKIERISNLPTLPQIASRLLMLVNEPSTSAADVAGLVGQDVSLSAKILRLANSAYYGAPREIASIQSAVVRLGFKVINTMVISLTVFDMFPSGRHSARFDRRAFWRHCIYCGLLSKLIAQQDRPAASIDPEEAFCAGLLHDIGKIVMDQYLHDDFLTSIEYAQRNSLPCFAAENETLGYTHTDVAQWLITRWELPDSLSEPIVLHHTPDKAASGGVHAAICHCADVLCYDAEISAETGSAPPLLSPQALERAGLRADVIPTIKKRCVEQIAAMDTFFELLR